MNNKILEKNKFLIILFSLIILLITSFIVSICVGSQKISLNDLLQILNLEKQENIDNKILMLKNIILKIRIPRSLLVMFTGFTLAGAGCIFQGFFRNPLAEPGIMGVTSGATLGAVCSLLLPSFFLFKFIQSISFLAFIGAILSGLIIFLLSKKANGYTSSSSVILTGTALGTLFSSITSIILLSKQNQLHSIYVWLLGSFSGKGWNEFYFLIIPFCVSLILIFVSGKYLDLISVGEISAQSLGLNVKKTRFLILITGSICVSCSVCAGGTIGFVGLISPHIIRILFSSKHKFLIPLSIIFGGVLLLVSDTIARVILSPIELPVGIITSLLGSPFFISLIFSRQKDL
jgi:iron complex transport system permease protein